jgi:hypothetical protein
LFSWKRQYFIGPQKQLSAISYQLSAISQDTIVEPSPMILRSPCWFELRADS